MCIVLTIISGIAEEVVMDFAVVLRDLCCGRSYEQYEGYVHGLCLENLEITGCYKHCNASCHGH